MGAGRSGFTSGVPPVASAGRKVGYLLARGLTPVIHCVEIDCALDLATLYEGLTFRPLPRLVRDDGTAA